MADASSSRPAREPVEEAPSNSTGSFEELRHLILAPEQEALHRLDQRVANPDARTADVSSVLAEAIQLRRAQEGDVALRNAWAPTIESSLRESVRRDPTALADALFPVMGPAIRRSILETLRAFLDSFNQVMDRSLSWQGLRWRLEAWRTGRSFSDVVLLHSLVFRVEQVFLIHKQTGLPLGHAVAPSVATEDPTLVSGMLSAIQDFVHDSFHTAPDQRVDRMNIGDLDVWIEHGPQASLAAVIRGIASRDLRDRLAETLENIHRQYAAELERFDGNTAPFQTVNAALAHCLEFRYKQETPHRGRGYVWAAAIVLCLLAGAGFGWRWWQYRRWSQLVSALREQPGFLITSFDRERGRFVIRGLRDPLASDPSGFLKEANLDPRSAEFHWGAYYALDDAIVQRRATGQLAPPDGVTLAVENGTLFPRGRASSAWVADLLHRAVSIPGIQTVSLSGMHIEESAALAEARNEIQNTVITFPLGSATLSVAARASLRTIAPKLKYFFSSPGGYPDMVFEVVGHSDSSGAEVTNQSLSQHRADHVVRQLIRLGIPEARLRTKGVAATEPLRPDDTEENRKFNRSVTLRVPPPRMQ